MNSNPIGIFDSGVGGTSIWKEIHELLPNESTIYLADSKNAPYGEKSSQEILDLSIKNTELLLEKKCKIIVVACNTATTNAITYLRKKFEIPFIGIEPAIKPAAINSMNGVVGILATKGTLTSELFSKTTDMYAGGITIVEQRGEGLVPLIEAGKIETTEMRGLLKRYLEPFIAAKADYLVLGCTHYPYLIPEIKKILPDSVQIIDSGEAVARQTGNILKKHNLLNNRHVKPSLKFFTNSDKDLLKIFLSDVKDDFEADYLNF